MSIERALRILDKLRKGKTIRRWALMGSVAASLYTRPVTTEDVDVIIEVDSDKEFISVFRSLASVEGTRGLHILLGGTPVQLFPTTIGALYKDTLAKAWVFKTQSGGLSVRTARPEHLIILALQSYRPKDIARIMTLVGAANKHYLSILLKRFDDADEKLARRLTQLLAISHSR